MNVLIIGGSGYIGKHLTKALLARKDSVAILSRATTAVKPAFANVEVIRWNGSDLQPVLNGRGFDAIINLAGETIGKWPWTAAHKYRVLSSRVETIRQVTEYLKEQTAPITYVQASGVGYYGHSTEPNITEDHPRGEGFLADVAVDWEAAAESIEAMSNVRVCIMRTGLVLSGDGGVLGQLSLPMAMFVGGSLGNGDQGMPWIHMDDVIAGYLYCLDVATTRGRYNLCSPTPSTNQAFMKELGTAMNRPVWLPMPSFALKVLLGEMSALLLDGQFAKPRHLIADGFTFKFKTLAAALENIYGKSSQS